MPSLLDAWLADPSGEIVGAVLDGTLVAFARRAWLRSGHAWFEGIRTDPAARGRGAEDLRRLMQAIHRQYAGRHIETMVPKTADREAPTAPGSA